MPSSLMHQFRAALDGWRAGRKAEAFAAVAALPDFPGDPRAARRWARLSDAEARRFDGWMILRRSPVRIECPWGPFLLTWGPGRRWPRPVPVFGGLEVRDFLREFLAWADAAK